MSDDVKKPAFVVLHQPNRPGGDPEVFFDVSEIRVVFPEGARAGIMLKGMPAPLKVEESSREVMQRIYHALGEEPPKHLGLEGMKPIKGLVVES